MKQFSRIAVFTLFALLVCSGAVMAQATGNIELKSVAEVEVEQFNEEGKKEIVRVPAGKVIPGDEVIYTNHYTNVGQEALENVAITNPIPQHMLYRKNSAVGEGATVTYSIDGGKTYDVPKNLKKVGADGKEYQAGPSDYTHIQWSFQKPVPKEGKGYVEFRAQLQ